MGFIGFWVLITIGLLQRGLIPVAIISGVLCALFLRFFLKRQSRIRFGAANLKVAAMAVRAMPGTTRIALCMSVVQVVWSIVSAMAAAGSIAALSTVVAPDGTRYSAAECMDRLTATVTGSVASWWFSPVDVSAVNGAFYRATHGSLGSLCKAAAATTVLRVLMHVVRRFSLLRRILSRVHSIVGYGVSYTICFISIYGLSFSEALRRVTELFRLRGLTVILNDAVVSIGLALLVVGQTVLYFALTTMLVVIFVDFSFTGMGVRTVILAMLFVAPIVIVFWVNIEVVRSSHKAVVVCFVQDPDALRANHDTQTYDELSEAWRQSRRHE
eukprot:g5810.t1